MYYSAVKNERRYSRDAGEGGHLLHLALRLRLRFCFWLRLRCRFLRLRPRLRCRFWCRLRLWRRPCRLHRRTARLRGLGLTRLAWASRGRPSSRRRFCLRTIRSLGFSRLHGGMVRLSWFRLSRSRWSRWRGSSRCRFSRSRWFCSRTIRSARPLRFTGWRIWFRCARFRSWFRSTWFRSWFR